ncbi:MAG: PAS domain S-box protein [Chitinophagaceae bacterium]|nr:PAS domain S-box protein [Chitinophagaceae bacterium]
MSDLNKGLRILIIEDNPGDQYLITELLTASDLKIQLLRTAENLVKATDFLQKEIFDIILLDIVLPESSGIDTFKTVKKSAGKIPVIILSGLADMNVAVDAITLGAQDYILKEDLDEKVLTKMILYSIERKSILEKLRESEVKYRSMIERNLAGVYQTTLDGHILTYNEAFADILGYGLPAELLQTKASGLYFSTDDRNDFIARLLEKGELINKNVKLKHKNGTPVHIIESCSLIKNVVTGEQIIEGVILDITERVKAEEALSKSEIYLRGTLDSTKDGILAIDINGKIITSNNRFAELWHIPQGLIEQKDDQALLEYVLGQLINPEEFLLKVQELYKTDKTDFDIIQFRDNRVFERHSTPLILNQDIVGRVWSFADITERKKAEDALRESEETFRRLFDESADMILLLDDTGFTDCNQSAVSAFGYSSKQDVLYRKPWEISPERQPDGRLSSVKAEEMIAQALQKGYNRFEWVHIKSDGTEFPVEVMLTSISVKGKQSYYALLRDITERKKTQKALEESENLLKESQAIAGLGNYTWNLSSGLWSSSKILDDIFGIGQNYDRSFKGWTDLIHPAWREIMSAYVTEEVVGKHQRFDKEYKIVRNDNGAEAWVHGLGVLEYDNNKRPIKLIGTISDVTDRKKTEELLKKSEEKYRTLVQQASDPILIYSLEGNILDYNNAFMVATGYQKGDIKNLKLRDLLFEDDLKIKPLRFGNIRKGNSVHDERRARRKDGSEMYIELNSKMMPDGNVMVIARDITERNKAVEEILNTNARFQMISKATSDIVWDWNLTDENAWWNDNYYALLGIRKGKELTELKDWYNRIHPDDLSRVKDKIGKAIQGNADIWRDEYRYAKADGTYLHFLDRGYIMRKQDGQAYRMIGSMVNMTPVYMAQKEVAESENRLRIIFETDPQCIKLLGPRGELLDMNPAGLAMIEADSLKQVKGHRVLDIIDTEYKKDFSRLTKNVFNGRSGTLLFSITGFKGTRRWLETHAVPMKDAAGKITALLGVTMDVTDKITVQKELMENEEKYRTLVEQAVDAIALYDATGKILDVNTGSVNLLGYSKEELMQMYLADILTKEEIQKKPVRYDILQKGDSTVKQRKMRRKDSSIVETEVRSQQLPDGRFLSVIRDLTERAKAQDLILKEKQLSNEIIDSIPGVFFLRDKNKFLRWNKQFEIITGYTSGEISKLKPVIPFYNDVEMGNINESINKIFTEGTNTFEATPLTKDGKKIPFYFITRQIIYEGKQCLVVTGIDISDRKKAEQELEESYKSIRKLTEHLQNIREEERAHIAREIHDELGQQLTVMKMDISWINNKLGIKDESVKTRISELLLMLDDTVKTVRRISSELRPSLLDDLGLTAAMEWQLSEFEKRFDIKTHFKFEDAELKLPETIKMGLFRIFQESLTNVARHSGTQKVTVSLKQENNLIVLSIADEGVGFDKQKTAAKKTLGILGMRERTAMIGGTYEIFSKPGKGTRVIVKIPLVDSNKI